MSWRDVLVEWIPYFDRFESETITDVLTSLLVLGAGWAFWRLFKGFLLPAFERFSEKTENVADDVLVAMVKALHRGFFQLVTLYLALLPWEMHDKVWTVVHRVFVAVLFFQLAFVLRAGYNAFFDLKVKRHAETRPGLKTSLDLMRTIGVFVIYIVVTLVALANLGFDISALVAGLGIGGIAVALGVQKVLADFFSSLFIILDRPFEAGDGISVADVNGTVERVGLRTTRIRSVTGEEVIMSNAELASARLRNFKRLNERRVLFRIGLEYDSPAAKVEELTAAFKKIVTETPHVRFDRCHFVGFAASSLDIETAYYVVSADYSLFMDTQQSVNLRVMKSVEAAGLKFAFPTQTIHVTK